MALIPCAVFALRIKVRTLFGIKVSLYVEINYTFFMYLENYYCIQWYLNYFTCTLPTTFFPPIWNWWLKPLGHKNTLRKKKVTFKHLS